MNWDKGLTRLGYICLVLSWAVVVSILGFENEWAKVGEITVYWIVFGGLCSVVYRLFRWALRGFREK